MHRIALLSLFTFAACGSPQYQVSTCSFTGQTDGCEASAPIDQGSARVQYHFTLINPRNPTQCAGELELSVVNGLAQYHGKELDPATCRQVGDDIEGMADVRGSMVRDVYFPTQDFTFRISVSEQ